MIFDMGGSNFRGSIADGLSHTMGAARQGEAALDDMRTTIVAAEAADRRWGERFRLYKEYSQLLYQQGQCVNAVARQALRQVIDEGDAGADRLRWAEEMLGTIEVLAGYIEGDDGLVGVLATIRTLISEDRLREAAETFEPLIVMTNKLAHETYAIDGEPWPSMPRV